jgi:hypothetical protein
MYYARGKSRVKEGGVYGDGSFEKRHLEEPKRNVRGGGIRHPKSS